MGKQQKKIITLPKKLKPKQRLAVATEVIDYIVKRTRELNRDKDGKKFAGSYSKEYKKSLDYKNAGKPKSGRPINLTLSSEMLDSLKLLDHKSNKITIGYDSGNSKLNGKVEGNRKGTYGNKKQVAPKRDFLGISGKQLTKILSKHKSVEESQDVLDQSDVEETYKRDIRTGDIPNE